MATDTRKGMDGRNQRAPILGGSEAQTEQTPIRVDGFAQVLAMLQIADAPFRESLLRRLAARDPELAAQLRIELRNQGIS